MEDEKSRIPVVNVSKKRFFKAIENIYCSNKEFLLQILILFLNNINLIKRSEIASTGEEYNVLFEINFNQKELQCDSENSHYHDYLRELEIHTQIINVTILNDRFVIPISVTGIIRGYTGEIHNYSKDYDFIKILENYMTLIEEKFQEFVSNTGMGLFNSFSPLVLDTYGKNPYWCYTNQIQNEMKRLEKSID